MEWRCFESTLHAGKVRANITLALAISAQAINQKRTVMRKTEISENPAFTFRTFLLRLGLIGPEYKNVREHLLSNLPGDRAWRYDKSQYITNVSAGCGLIRCAGNIVPFENSFPRNTRLYQLMTTKPDEALRGV